MYFFEISVYVFFFLIPKFQFPRKKNEERKRETEKK